MKKNEKKKESNNKDGHFLLFIFQLYFNYTDFMDFVVSY